MPDAGRRELQVTALAAAKAAATAWKTLRDIERDNAAKSPRSAQYKILDASIVLDDIAGAKAALRELVVLALTDIMLDVPRWSHAVSAAAILDDPAAITTLVSRADAVVERPIMVAGSKREPTPFQRTLVRALAAYATSGPSPLGTKAEAELAASDPKSDDLRVGIGRLIAAAPDALPTVMVDVLADYDRRIARFGATRWSWPLTQIGVLAFAHHRGVALAHPYVPVGLIT